MTQSGLCQKIQNDLITALKGKEAFKVKVLRFLKSQLDSAAKDKRADLTDEEAVRVIHKKIKQSQDAIEKYGQGGRPELADSEQAEVDLVSAYLPAQLSASELDAIVEKVVAGAGEITPKDFGRLMGMVMKEVGGSADGKAVKDRVESALRKV